MATQTVEPAVTSTPANPRVVLSPTPMAVSTATPTARPSSTATEIVVTTPAATSTLSPLALTVANIEHIKQLAVWGKGKASSTAWSHDGALLAVGTTLGVYLFDAHSLAQTRFIKTDEAVHSVAFSPNANILATGTTQVEVWNPETGARLGVLTGSISLGVETLAFSPGGTWLAALGLNSTEAGAAGRLIVWRVADSQMTSAYDTSVCMDKFAFSPDGLTIAVPDCIANDVDLFTVKTGASRTLKPGFEVRSAAFSPDGSGLLVGKDEYDISLLSLTDGTILKNWTADGGGDFKLLPDGHTVLLASATDLTNGDVKSQLLDLTTGQVRWFPQALDLDPASFSLDGTRLATIGADQSIQIWDLSGTKLIKSIPWEQGAASLAFGSFALANNALQDVLAVGGTLGQVSIIDPRDGKTLQTYQVNGHPVSAIALDATGRMLALGDSSGDKSVVTILDTQTKQTINTIDVVLSGDSRPQIDALAFSADGRAILAEKERWGDGLAWDIHTGQSIAQPDNILWYRAGDFGADQQGHLTTVTYDVQNTVFTFKDLFTNRLLASIPDEQQTGECQFTASYALSADHRYLGMGCELPAIRIWDLAKAKLADSLEGHRVFYGDGGTSSVLRVVFGPSNYLLISSGTDGTVRFWDAETGKSLLALQDRNAPVGQLEISTDGQYLASGSDDGTYQLWGLKP